MTEIVLWPSPRAMSSSGISVWGWDGTVGRGSQVPYQGGRPNFRFTLDPLPDGTLKWTHGEGGGAALS